MDEKIIELRKPVVIGDMTVDKLELREPLAGEMEKAFKEATPIGQAITLISIISKNPRRIIESLCRRDLQEANDFLESFSNASPAIGSDLSQ